MSKEYQKFFFKWVVGGRDRSQQTYENTETSRTYLGLDKRSAKQKNITNIYCPFKKSLKINT